MKFGGGQQERSKVDIGGNSLINGPLGQIMALKMLQNKTNIGQQSVGQQAPGDMVATGLSPGEIAPSYASPGGEAALAASKASAVAPIEIEKAKKQQQQTEAQESIMRGETALNQLQYGVSRFKALQNANKIDPNSAGITQKMQGSIGHLMGKIGQNPEDPAWDDFTKTVATQLSAAASPRTPTMLVQYYQSVLGPGNQTMQEFARRVHILTSEIEGRKAGYSQTPYDQSIADKRVQQLLSTPPAQDPMNFYPKGNADVGIPNGSNQNTGAISQPSQQDQDPFAKYMR